MSAPPTPSTSGAAGLRGEERDALLWVEDLSKVFVPKRFAGARGRSRSTTAVAGVSFDVRRGETFGLVGESGCGKSTIVRCILRLTDVSGGRVVFDGVDLGGVDREAMRRLRRRMQMVFQDPLASLDPRMSVGATLEEPLVIHGVGSREERAARVGEILELVGLGGDSSRRKPHAFSGGQRQRVGIARALITNPDLVLLDEPVSALDVSVQAQVLNLLRSLQEQLALTYVFVAHDLAIAEYFCDRLAVLYLGHVMELGERDRLFRTPLNPYTVALLSAVPLPDTDRSGRRERIVLQGEVASSGESAHGCPFESRCPVGRGRVSCRDRKPPLEEVAPGHWVSCHFPGELGVTW